MIFPEVTYWLLKLSAALFFFTLHPRPFFSNLKGILHVNKSILWFCFDLSLSTDGCMKNFLSAFSRFSNKNKDSEIHFFISADEREKRMQRKAMHEKNRRFHLRITPERIIKRFREFFRFYLKFTIFPSIISKPQNGTFLDTSPSEVYDKALFTRSSSFPSGCMKRQRISL